MFGFIRKKIVRINKRNPLMGVDLPCCPVSDQMGYDRGTPIDRYYIEQFMKRNENYIRGDILEIGDSTYSDRFAHDVLSKNVFTFDQSKKGEPGYIIGDLATGDNCKENSFDCFILTQTLPFIYDIWSAGRNLVAMLKSDGVALITVPGISMISVFDYDRWGEYWGFTKHSCRKLFENISDDDIEIESFGNAKVCTYFLYGLSSQDLNKKDFNIQDERFPLIITVKIRKK